MSAPNFTGIELLLAAQRAAADRRTAENATPFERAALALDLLSDGPWAEIGSKLWAELTPPEQAELHRRAASRSVVLRNALGGTVRP